MLYPLSYGCEYLWKSQENQLKIKLFSRVQTYQTCHSIASKTIQNRRKRASVEFSNNYLQKATA